MQWAQQFEELSAEIGLQLLPTQVAELARLTPCANLVLAEIDELPPLYEQALSAQAAEITRHRHRAKSAACRLQACQDAEQELYCAAQWAKNALEKNASASIAILLPNLGAQRQRFERILHEVFPPEEGGIPVNFSGGVPLATTTSVRTALALLTLLEPVIEVESLLPLLHSRYRDQREQEAEIRLIRQLYQHGRARIGSAQLRYFCRDLALGQQLLRLSQQRELRHKHAPSRWCELLSQCLQVLGWPGAGPLNSDEYQQLEHWYACLERMAGLDEVCGLLDCAAACSLLQRTCSDTIFQVQTADEPIQVLGLLEAAGLQFQYLWLTGMSSSDWPAPAHPNPFVPFGLQKIHGMPHADSQREHHYARHLLDQYQHGSAELVASYAEIQDEVLQQPSPLLMDFSALPHQPAIDIPGGWHEYTAVSMQQLPAETSAPALGDEEALHLRGGSGLIQDQSHCGFRAFVQHRLKTRSQGELAVGLTPADRGLLLHDALYDLWGALGDSNCLLGSDETELRTRITSAVQSAIEAFIKHNPDLVGHAYLELEQYHLRSLLRKWLDIEAQRSTFVVHAREEKCELQLGKLRLHLRIDRIDRLPDGSRFIVDYKSGNAEIRYWLGPRPQDPQLPLYCEALGEPTSGVSFAVVRPDDAGWRGLGRENLGPGISADIAKASARQEYPLADWTELRESWQHTLQELAQQFIDGQARVDPLDPQLSCRWCGLQALCRIGEVSEHGGH